MVQVSGLAWVFTPKQQDDCLKCWNKYCHIGLTGHPDHDAAGCGGPPKNTNWSSNYVKHWCSRCINSARKPFHSVCLLLDEEATWPWICMHICRLVFGVRGVVAVSVPLLLGVNVKTGLVLATPRWQLNSNSRSKHHICQHKKSVRKFIFQLWSR